MQPTNPPRGGRTPIKRWGPVLALGVVAALIIGVVVFAGGDDDPDDVAEGTTSTTAAASDVTTPDGEVLYPLRFSTAQEAGLEDLDWGDRCDEDTGRAAMPDVGAPECYLPFEGDNGGATDDGVTADSIKIVVYQGPDNDPIADFVTDAVKVDDTNAENQHSLDRLVDLYETYHETYGRSVEIEYYVSEGFAQDSAVARADAVTIAEEIKPFQVWGGPSLTEAFAEELAARGIQCIACAGGDQAEMEERAPYNFGLGLTSEQGLAHNVEALATQVAGRPAEFAGDEAMREQERTFGYIHIELNEETGGIVDQYEDQLADAGIDLVERIPYALDPATLQETAASGITRLKEAGVTTVIFGGDPVAPREFTREATAQDYHPEWFINLSVLVDLNAFARTYDQEQWSHAFGISNLGARVDPDAYGPRVLYEWFYAETPQAEDGIGLTAPNPALFFKVLQEVGPNLTHETFRDAIFRLPPDPLRLTVASNSFGDHSRWPTIEGDDHQGPDDVTKIWWDPEAEGPDELGRAGAGMYRFVDGGRRYLSGEWPDEEFRAFDERDAPAIYDDVPESEAPGEYEPLPAG